MWENCLSPRGRGSSELRSCHCTPAWGTERDSISKKRKKKKKEKKRMTFALFCSDTKVVQSFRNPDIFYLEIQLPDVDSSCHLVAGSENYRWNTGVDPTWESQVEEQIINIITSANVEKIIRGRAQWLMPVTPALWEAEGFPNHSCHDILVAICLGLQMDKKTGQEFETSLANM
ncbi:hypothetical protein AAY473_023600, partial [Plecturocebus cupreus]